MQFKEGLNPENGCARWWECPKMYSRCCILCEEPCKKCTPSAIFFRQTVSWKLKECQNLRHFSELAFDSIFKRDPR